MTAEAIALRKTFECAVSMEECKEFSDAKNVVDMIHKWVATSWR